MAEKNAARRERAFAPLSSPSPKTLTLPERRAIKAEGNELEI